MTNKCSTKAASVQNPVRVTPVLSLNVSSCLTPGRPCLHRIATEILALLKRDPALRLVHREHAGHQDNLQNSMHHSCQNTLPAFLSSKSSNKMPVSAEAGTIHR